MINGNMATNIFDKKVKMTDTTKLTSLIQSKEIIKLIIENNKNIIIAVKNPTLFADIPLLTETVVLLFKFSICLATTVP